MAKGIRDYFTDEEILSAVRECDSMSKAAKQLSETGKAKVSPQLLRYWVSTVGGEEADAIDMNKTEQQKRAAQVENNRLRKINREVLDAERTKSEVLEGIAKAVEGLNQLPPVEMQVPPIDGRPMTAELLFSDLQIGKLMSDYNSEVAVRRIEEYARVAIGRIWQALEAGYCVERIMFCMIGDIIESDKKHDNSARACDTGTAQQVEQSIRLISQYIISPLAELGIPMDVICVTGNHDHDDHGLNMFKPGREHLSWPLYHALKLIHDAYGHDHLKWSIPEGAFHIDEIYGFKTLYEHGVGVAASEASMTKRLAQRTAQVKEYLTMFRMGDKHNICRFNNDAMVVNGAFFGDDREGSEYSGICGYAGYPAQLMFMHVPRKDNFRLPIHDSLAIQLGHIK